MSSKKELSIVFDLMRSAALKRDYYRAECEECLLSDFDMNYHMYSYYDGRYSAFSCVYAVLKGGDDNEVPKANESESVGASCASNGEKDS